MANQILKNSSGAIWKNSAGQVLRNRPINETLLPQGLIGEFDADNVENVGGYCKTMYNKVSGGVNFVQNTIASQPLIVTNYKNGRNSIACSGTTQVLNGSFANVKTIIGVLNFGCYLGGIMQTIYTNLFLGSYANTNGIVTAGVVSPFYRNNVYFTTSCTNTFAIICSYSNFNVTITRVGVDPGNDTLLPINIGALALYNRKLSIEEIFYNTKAYGARYAITV